jgi:hypothetical protein
LSQRRILLWKYVKTASYAYPLEEIDSMVSFAEPKLPAPKEAPKRVESSEEVLNNVSAGDSGDDKKEHKHHKKHHFSVLEMIVYTSNHSVEDKLERAHMLEIPFIHQLLFDKWNGYAGTCFHLWMFVHMTFLAVLTTFIIWGTDNVFDQASFWGLQAFILAYAVFAILFEFFDIIRMGKLYFYMSSLNFHISIWLFSCLVIANFALNFYGTTKMNCNLYQVYENSLLPTQPGGNSTATGLTDAANLPPVCVAANVCIGLAGLFAWYFFMYFGRGFPTLGLYIISFHVMFFDNVLPFVVIFFIFMMSFSLGFFPIWATDSWAYIYGISLLSTLETSLFSTNMGYSDLQNSSPPTLVVIYFLMVIFVVGFLMINMLIASMGDTYELIREEKKDQLLFEWTSTVLLIERRIVALFKVAGIKFDQGITLPGAEGIHFRVEEQEEEDELNTTTLHAQQDEEQTV